jgi:hypothetical protein
MMPSLGRLIDDLTSRRVLDGPARLVARVGRGTPRRIADRGEGLLGHPSHPLFTDLPIGFWTSAWVLDLLPGGHSDVAARRLLALGVLSTAPAVVTGLGDATYLDHEHRRAAAVHGALNVAATIVFAYSWWLRRNGTTPQARLTCHLGAALATAAGAIGGHLAFLSSSDD